MVRTNVSHSLSELIQARKLVIRSSNNQSPISWNILIRGYTSSDSPIEAIWVFRKMRQQGTKPNKLTFPFLLKSCAMASALQEGTQVHANAVKCGFESDVYVCNNLINFYGFCKKILDARKVFDEMTERSMVSWTAVIVGYARCGDMSEARKLFDVMPDRDVAAFNVIIDGYVKLGCMDLARDLFDKMRDQNVISWTSMVYGYCQNGDVESARLMFDLMPEKNLFTWNAMIKGYCQNKRPHEALKLFCEMKESEAVQPNEVTVMSVLPAVADLGALDWGCWIHKFAQRKQLDGFVHVGNALVDMYAKCGEIAKAKLLFEEMPVKETASWNALINGYAVNGYAKEALEVFASMIQKGFEPNETTMTSVLSACNHCGLIEDGRKVFKEMDKFGIVPQIEQYGCMIDLLGRAGCLDEAENLIQAMPYDANEIILSSFLFACCHFKDVSRAERVLKLAAEAEKEGAGNYVMLRNLYITEQRWMDVEDVKQLMKKRGSNKEVACSVIEIDGSFREFVAGNYLHSHLEVIQLTLGQLWKHMKVETIY